MHWTATRFLSDYTI